jgi:hypothetical protein
MGLGRLWLLLPDEALPLVLVIAAFGVMFGLMRGRSFLGLVALIVFLPVLGLLLEQVLGALPPWVALLVLVAAGLSTVRALASLVLGARAADHMVGILAADVVRLALVGMFIPFRLLARAARAGLNGLGGRH